MTSDTTKCDSPQPAEEASAGLFDNWFDPIERALRDRVRGFIEDLIQGKRRPGLSITHKRARAGM